MSHHIVEVRDLHYTYPDGTLALQGINFRILHGEAVAIVGANGSGKSTLTLHMNGSVQPTSGTVRIGDLPINKATLNDVRRTVGMIFQNPDDQLFMPTAGEDVAFGPLNLGLPPEEIDACVNAALTQVGALHLHDRPPYHLSGGEKRAVAIATVLAMNPSILVMDEPSSGLDPFARRLLISQLQSFQHTRIVATHDMDLVLDLCPRTIILHNGKIAADGLTHELFSDQTLLERCRLEPPLSWKKTGLSAF